MSSGPDDSFDTRVSAICRPLETGDQSVAVSAPLGFGGIHRRMESDADVTQLVLRGGTFTDGVFDAICELKDLMVLDLATTQISNEGLSKASELKRLQVLDLSDTRIGDQGVANLAEMTQLRFLNLEATEVTDRSLLVLAGLPLLEDLDLSSCNVTGQGFESFVKQARAASRHPLRYLSLGDTKVDDSALPHIGSLESLEVLKLDGTRVSDKGLEHLSNLKKLRQLTLQCTNVIGQGFEYLSGCDQLETLVGSFLSTEGLTSLLKNEILHAFVMPVGGVPAVGRDGGIVDSDLEIVRLEARGLGDPVDADVANEIVKLKNLEMPDMSDNEINEQAI